MNSDYTDYEHTNNRSRKLEKRRRYELNGWPAPRRKCCGMSQALRIKILTRKAERRAEGGKK